MTYREQYKGIYVPLITPFNEDGSVNYEALVNLIDKTSAKGVDGFYVAGSSGEPFMMSMEEKKEVLRVAAEAARGKGKLIAHVGCLYTKDAMELARYAEECGYDAVSSVPPYYYKFTFEDIKQYYFDIASASSLPVLLYSIPICTGVTFTLQQFTEILSDDRFIGLKFTGSDYFMLEELRTHFPTKVIYNGADEMLSAGLAMGADGGIGTTYNCMPDKIIGIYQAKQNGDVETMQHLQQEVNALIAEMVKIGVLPAIKVLLNAQGMEAGKCREPFLMPNADACKAFLEVCGDVVDTFR